MPGTDFLATQPLGMVIGQKVVCSIAMPTCGSNKLTVVVGNAAKVTGGILQASITRS